MLELVEKNGSPASLKVIGVGGGGSNAVNRMVQAGLMDVEFWISNTDLQALERTNGHNRLQIGKTVTRGLGAGGDPEVGRLSAEEDLESIQQVVEGADMIFLTAGMGGGTGTGAAPVFARVAREMGVLTVAIVTKPFQFEGKKKMKRALHGLEALSEHVDTLIAIPNQKLLQIVEPGTSFDDALLMADEVLFQATRGISDLITGHGIINLDFADVRTVMRDRGNALLGSGMASGEDRAIEAAQLAISSPLLEEISIDGAQALLINIQGGASMSFHEAAEAAQYISDRVGEEADVFWGAVVDPELENEIRVTLVATGFPQPTQDRIGPISERRAEAAQPSPAPDTGPAGHEPRVERPVEVERDAQAIERVLASNENALAGEPETRDGARDPREETPVGSSPTRDSDVEAASRERVDESRPDSATPESGSPEPRSPERGSQESRSIRSPEPRSAERGSQESRSLRSPESGSPTPRSPEPRSPEPASPERFSSDTTRPAPSGPTRAGATRPRPAAPGSARTDLPGSRPTQPRSAQPGSSPAPGPGRGPQGEPARAESGGKPSRPRPARPETSGPRRPVPREPELPFWREQPELDGTELGLVDPNADWEPAVPVNGKKTASRKHRNPLDVPTFMRKPMD